jgi:uncharacterized protein YjbI with pentapeptide repeats
LVLLAFMHFVLFSDVQADIFRWDNGQLIPGTEAITPGPGVQLNDRQLIYASVGSTDLSNANFSNSNLTNAYLHESTLTGANLSGAVVKWAGFGDTTSRGFTKEQLYSTASYQARNLQGSSSYRDM